MLWLTIARVAMPTDIQMLGALHGGVILGLIEEAGDIISTKYCNLQRTPTSVSFGNAIFE